MHKKSRIHSASGKFVGVLTCIAFSFHILPLHATTDTLTYNECLKDDYTFELGDANQKKVAIGMVAWGIIMATGIALLAAFIPDSTDPDATTGSPTPSGSLF